jgi:putative DNA primase/helicase
MSGARTIAQALRGRRNSDGFLCRCPVPTHGQGRGDRNPSLFVRDGDLPGRLLVRCFSGCDRLDVLAELRRSGLLNGHASDYRQRPATTPRHNDATRTARALSIWREARPAAGTIVERYLQSRQIIVAAWPAALRFHPRCPHPSGAFLPAMVALVEHSECGPVAIHRTYLRSDGAGKAATEPDKASLGPIGGGAVRLGMPRAGEWLAAAEGIETALSVATACAIPAWAALSGGGLRALLLPGETDRVIICADNDANSAGQSAARDAAARWLAEGRRVRLALPPEVGTDFNDVLVNEASHGG